MLGLLCGCGSSINKRQAVVNAYGPEVYDINPTRFLARNSKGEVWLVDVHSVTTNISGQTLIFGSNR